MSFDYAEVIRQQEERLKEQIPAFVSALEAQGIEEIIFYYEGEGDEGSIYDTEFVQGGEAIKFDEPELERDLSDFAYNLLSHKIGGWMDGNGSQGTLTFDVATQTLTIQNSVRVYDYEEEEPIKWPPQQGESGD